MRVRLLPLGLAILCACPASGQPRFSQLRLIAPAAPGGGWDQTARAMQVALQSAGIADTISVENIPGAAGTIGLARFISAERGQGDVLMVSGLIMVGAVITHQSPVTLQQVTPIARLTAEYEVFAVPAASPLRTLTDLVDALRMRPESVSWGGGSAGGTDQIVAGLFAQAVGVDPRRINYIPFAGGGESLSAILGGQVSVGVSGLGEFAAHVQAGTLRVLAVSSGERVAGLDAPTFREQGVDLELENWRSLVAPPGIGPDLRERLERAVADMVRSPPWRAALERYRWSDRYLAGPDFVRFAASEETRVQGILARLGTSAPQAMTGSVGRYPLFVLLGLGVCGVVAISGWVRERRLRPTAVDDVGDAARAGWRRLIMIAAAVLMTLVLLERLGFVVTAAMLFWLTARSFDASRPLRDAGVAIVVAVAAYVLFARFLQLPLPPGPLGGIV